MTRIAVIKKSAKFAVIKKSAKIDDRYLRKTSRNEMHLV